jgi:uncharacterized membrane protein/thiol-disulfide isomerase/thioredoxin
MLRKLPLPVLVVLLGLILPWKSPVNAQPDLQSQEGGVVRVFMFWSSTCGHCEYVINQVLPPIQEQYGEQFEILMVELAAQEDVDSLYETAAIVGIPKEQVGVPFMLIGDQVLLGSDQISNELPGLLASHLASGGIDYPRLQPLVDYLPEPADTGASAPIAIAEVDPADDHAAEPRSNGFTLALVVLVGMVLALAYVLFALLRDTEPGGRPRADWIDWLIPLVVVLGMGVAGYLTYIESTSVQAVCGPVGDCNAVQNSLREDRLGDYARLAMLGMALFGTLYSIYLTYIELWVIYAVCIWCLSSAVLITLLMLLSIRPAREALDSLGENEEEL